MDCGGRGWWGRPEHLVRPLYGWGGQASACLRERWLQSVRRSAVVGGGQVGSEHLDSEAAVWLGPGGGMGGSTAVVC